MLAALGGVLEGHYVAVDRHVFLAHRRQPEGLDVTRAPDLGADAEEPAVQHAYCAGEHAIAIEPVA